MANGFPELVSAMPTDPDLSSALSDLDAEKKAARKAASAARKAARVAAGSAAAEDLAEAILSSDAVPKGGSVSGFLPIGSEVDPGPALEALRARGHGICLPCVIAADTPLVFRLWQPGDPLVTESFGTRAPDPSAEAVKPDVLLVPLLAFDPEGYRLGYGGGFYDRSLEALRRDKEVIAVGVAYAGQQVDRVPRGPFDQPLDWIITEAGATRFGV